MPLAECSSALVSTLLPALSASSDSTAPPLKCSLGLVTYAILIQQKAHAQLPDLPDLSDPITFLKQALRLGAAGMQVPLGIREPAYCQNLRQLAEQNSFFVESTSVLPKTESDLSRFDTEMQTARQCGASIVRTVILPGRRYEQFKSFPEFKAAVQQGKAMLRLAEPVARRHQIRLAVENHKDQRTEERLQLLKEFDSEFIGATLDVGNNLALLEDPLATAEAFAPWTLTVHFKDQAVASYEHGFLLADVPVGQGSIDLPAILSLLQKKCPKARLSLELITRDPLQVPILADSYWPTLPDLPASQLSRMLHLLKKSGHPAPFETISTLPLAAQVKAEQRNITDSFKFAAEKLGLKA